MPDSSYFVRQESFSGGDVHESWITLLTAMAAAGGVTITGGIKLDTATGAMAATFINGPQGWGLTVNGAGVILLRTQSNATMISLTPQTTSGATAETKGLDVVTNVITIAGGYAVQRGSTFNPQTINGAFTITDAATVAIAGAPTGTSTFTRKYQLWLQGTDKMRIDTTTQSTIGANGAASALTALPVGYLPIYIGANLQIIPYYNP